MIGFLKGQLVIKDPPVVVLDVHGVGYELKVPMSGFYDLPDLGLEVQLFVHVVYREDAQNAYGFLNGRDRDFFRELIKINGVGPNLALTILSGLTVDECVQAVNNDEIARLTTLPGIGKRTAERLILELKPKLKAWSTVETSPQSTISRGMADAEAALIALGYKPAEAKRALDLVVSELETGVVLSSEDYIRRALRQLVRA